MTAAGSDGGDGGAPWWASGRDAREGLDRGEDPLDALGRAREGLRDAGEGTLPPDAARAVADAVDMLAQIVTETSRRLRDRAVHNAGPAQAPGNHDDGEVCDACPVCIALRAVRAARPDIMAHLADAAHHLTLAFQAFADAQASPDEGMERIDLDP